MGKKLNFPMISTFILDYTLNYSLIISYFYFFANNLNVFNVIVISLSHASYSLLHDPLHAILFPKMICKAKLNYKYTTRDYLEMLWITFQSTTILVIGVYYGLLHLSYTTFLKTYMEVTLEYWIMALLKDYTSMYFLHPWMHKPQNYWLHKHHHLVGVEVQANHAYSIDSLDAFLENQIALFIYGFAKWVIYGNLEIHFAAFIFLGLHDVFVHSLNPYSPVHYSPFLEYFQKINLEHNLHHMIQKDYSVFDSFRHLFDLKTRDQDLAKYNELCKTTFCFDLLVDEDKNIAY